MNTPRYQWALLIATLLTLLLAVGCGGGATATTTNSTSPAVLAATPSTVNFGNDALNNTASQMITITNTGTVAGTIESASVNGGGNAFVLANWTAPLSVPPGGKYNLTVSFTPPSAGSYSATLTLATSTSGNQVVKLAGTGVASTNSVSVSVSPTQAALQTGASQQFTATVTGTTNTAVNWLVNGVQGGSSSVGTISSNGLYTAPQTVPSGGSVSVTARSVADTTKSASAIASIAGAAGKVTVTVSPTSSSVAGGQSQQFTATVSGTSNTAVNWYVNGVQGGGGSSGSISSTGLYTATACPTQSADTVTARSVYDSTASASATVTVSGSAPPAGNYYVASNGSDSNNGSACKPWATIAHAASAVSAGAKVHVAPGTYSGPISTSASGTSSAHIRYISDTQWGAIIKCTGTCDMVWTQSGNYVDVMGFQVTSTNSATRIGFEWLGSNGLIQGNKIHDILCSGCTGNGGAGINVDNGSAYTRVDANYVYNIAIAGKGTAESLYVHGIYVHTHYNTISNNLVYGCAGWGIQQGHAVGDSTIVNNTVFQCNGGILIGSAGTGQPASDHNYVANNILFDVGPGYGGHGNGIEECCSSSDVGYNNTYTNNLVYQDLPTAYSFYHGSAVNAIVTNPAFVNYQTNGSGNYQLLPGSPAVDAGKSTNAPVFDIEGGKRPFNGAWDLGAYEFGTTAAKWPWD